MSIVGSNVLAGASGQGGYFLENSLRFRKSVSGHLSRTFTSAGSLTTWTWSAWVKRSLFPDTTALWSSNTTSDMLYIASGGNLTFYPGTSTKYVRSAALLQDPAAWYHVMVVWDTTNATDSERLLLYINGVKQTSANGATWPNGYPALNTTTGFNSNAAHGIGIGIWNLASKCDGYMTEINFIDGQALTADEFGEFDAATGVWKPKEYLGAYGTNGFYLPMTATTQAELQNTVKFNSTTATAKKVTGVGFSPDLVWFKSTSNAQNHYLIDTVRGGNSFIYSNANNAQNTSQQWIDEFGSDGFTATNNVLSNNYDYVAWCWDAGANQASTGISSVQYRGSGVTKKVTGFGFSPDLVWIKKRGDGTNTTDRHHVIFDTIRGPNNQLKPSDTIREYSEVDGITDEVMSFDSDGFTVGGSDNVNGTNAPYIAWCWDAGSGDPATNTDGDITSTVKANDATGFSIVTWTANGTADDRVGHGLNSAPEVIIYKDRSGAGEWYVWTTAIDGSNDTLKLNSSVAKTDNTGPYTSPNSTTISNYNYASSTTMVAYCFKSVTGVSDIGTYTGSGATGKVITTGFRPGFLMIKRTDGVGNWVIVDATRDPFTDYMENQLYANLTSDDYVDGQKYKFTDTGFEFLAGGSDVNGSGSDYIYMAFKGSYSDYVAPINTDGTTTSRVKANTEKGFSIVRWQNVVDGTVGHGLNSAPEVILQKELENAVLWRVFHYLMTGSENYNPTDNLHLNENYAYPPAVGPASRINDVGSTTFKSTGGFSGTDQIAYCFHSVAGYSKFGSYVGNGSTSGTVVNTGFRPGFVLLKSVDSTSSWIMVDAVRDPDNLVSQYVYADLTSADATYTNIMEFTDTGFELRIAGGASNTNGQTYIYMAFADTRDEQFNFDASGNKNNWTPSGNINSNAPSEPSYDIMTDVPTLTDEDAGNYATINPLAKTPVAATYADGNLKVTTGAAGGDGFGTIAIPSSGKYYWEVISQSGTGGAMIGISDYLATRSYAWQSTNSVFYYATGNKYVDGSGSAYGSSYSNGDVIGVAVDADAGDIEFFVNNVSQGSITHQVSELFPVLSDGASSLNVEFTINFGQQPFAYTPPTGFKSLNTYNLPNSTIMDGSKHMNTVLYTGNGTTGHAITGVGFQPDLVWIKNRSAATSHNLADAVRGATKIVWSDLTTAETTATESIQSFDSDGFTVGNAGGINYNTRAFVGWNWKANGSGVSNTDGSITSTVSANTTAGFSIVTYTDNGSSGVSVGHGLGQKPDLIITKDRGTAGDWIVYTDIIDGSFDYFRLNTTAAKVDSGLSPFTSSVFYSNYGNSTDVVTYCFAAVEGFSSIATYTGNASTDGPFVYTGFRPAWILIKPTGSGTVWQIFDSVRETYNPVEQSLVAQSNAAEPYDTVSPVDFLSNGFKLRGGASSWNNYNTGTYIYMAFAENPFKNSLAR